MSFTVLNTKRFVANQKNISTTDWPRFPFPASFFDVFVSRFLRGKLFGIAQVVYIPLPTSYSLSVTLVRPVIM